MIWVRDNYVVERKKRSDGFHEFVISRGNKEIETIVPEDTMEEIFIQRHLKKGKGIYEILEREEPLIAKEKENKIEVEEIVEIKKPSLLLLNVVPFEDFHYLNSHGGKVGRVVKVIDEWNKQLVYEIKINEQEEHIFIEGKNVKIVENEYIRRLFENEERRILDN